MLTREIYPNGEQVRTIEEVETNVKKRNENFRTRGLLKNLYKSSPKKHEIVKRAGVATRYRSI